MSVSKMCLYWYQYQYLETTPKKDFPRKNLDTNIDTLQSPVPSDSVPSYV